MPKTTNFQFPKVPIHLTLPFPMEQTQTLLLLLLFILPTTTTQESPPNPSWPRWLKLSPTPATSPCPSPSAVLRLPSPSTTIFVPSERLLPPPRPTPSLPPPIPHPPRSAPTPIPTLLPNFSLTVTSSSLSSLHLSLNDVVVVVDTPIFDDCYLLLLPIDDFFNSSSLLLLPEEPFAAVSGVLKSNGFSIIAAFLEAQLATELANGARFTIFAPLDEAVALSVRNVTDYSAVFRKHVVPRLIPWRDLIRLRDETLLPTFSEGFVIRVSVAPRVRFLNGVGVAFPNMYRSGVIVVHGIDGLLDRSTV